jgi:hypothetical protein
LRWFGFFDYTPNPEEIKIRIVARAVHNAGMTPEYDFKLALTRVIEPTGVAGIELGTLADAARFVGRMKPFRQARLH